MYSYYKKVKSFIENTQKLIDSLESKGQFQDIPDLLLLKEKLLNLKQDFYNEEIQDSELVEKYNNLENIYKQLI